MSQGPTPAVLFFGDGKHPFLFLAAEWQELQRVTNCGPWEIEARLLSSRCSFAEMRETLRVGLLGGGMTPKAAADLVESYVGKRPGDLDEGRLVALGALGYSLHGLDATIAGESSPAPKRAGKRRPKTDSSLGGES